MAKALLGYSTGIGTDPRVVDRMALENRTLRQRVNDLGKRKLHGTPCNRQTPAKRHRYRLSLTGINCND